MLSLKLRHCECSEAIRNREEIAGFCYRWTQIFQLRAGGALWLYARLIKQVNPSGRMSGMLYDWMNKDKKPEQPNSGGMIWGWMDKPPNSSQEMSTQTLPPRNDGFNPDVK
jgi:hypothetical protein